MSTTDETLQEHMARLDGAIRELSHLLTQVEPRAIVKPLSEPDVLRQMGGKNLASILEG
jgi:hypothetical protein